MNLLYWIIAGSIIGVSTIFFLIWWAIRKLFFKKKKPEQQEGLSAYNERIKDDKKIKEENKLIDKHPDLIVLIRMELINGKHDEFLVKEEIGKKGFYYPKNDKKNAGFYFFQDDAKYYVQSSGLWAYDYHQLWSLPIKRKIPLDKIRHSVEALNEQNPKEAKIVELGTDPQNLNHLIKSEVVRQMLQGLKLSTWLKVAILILVVLTFITIVVFMIVLYDSGILQSFSNKGG